MSGKAYTMREMKTVVEYLVEHKFYGEIKGRKMWMDFANSQQTHRTWQSLKETFLKRILPDIHNPYYKLTIEQINSFRAGYDVMDRNKAKLEIHTISDDSSNGKDNPKDNELSNGKSNEMEITAGENKQCLKIPSQNRSSADTVILDNCYETAEEIQRDLESNGDKENDEKPTTMSKSLRDCITYSEPLTPMLQEVLDDFVSEPEDSDREVQLEIVENPRENDISEDNQTTDPKDDIPKTKNVADVAKNAKGLSAEVVEEVLAQELDSSSKPDNKSPKTKNQNSTAVTEELPVINLDDEISSMQAENGTEINDTEKNDFITAEDSVPKESEKTEVTVASEPQLEATTSSGHTNSNSTVDASLPNNPEALNNKTLANKTIEKNTPESLVEISNTSAKSPSPLKTSPLKTSPLKPSARKRSYSEDALRSTENKKKKFELKLTQSKILKNPRESPPVNPDKNKIKADDNKLKANKDAVTDRPMPASKKKTNIEKLATEFVKPSTSLDHEFVDKILLTSDTEKNNSNDASPEMKNPCLQNVSLFDEQFNKTKYNMSESSDTEQNKKETKVEKPKPEGTVPPRRPKDIVLLQSHSESDTEELKSPQKKKQRAGVLSTKSERDKAISNMFGFTSGGVGSKRRRQLSCRRRTISHNISHSQHHNAASNSSEWTSQSDSDAFVSPPRSRKNRPTRKYLKPKSARVLSLDEEGGLFVMYGKKIYPLVKDGRIVKNYLTYLPESDSEEGESYWKEKYVEEKKKAEELKKLLQKVKEPSRSRDSKSPILQPTPLRNSKPSRNQPHEPSNDTGKEICLSGREDKKEDTKVNPPEKIKIKFTRNNEEVHLEGHWPQIHPVLEQVVQIFHKEAESASEAKMIVAPPVQSKDPSSGGSTPIIITPVDPEVHEKVNKIEKEIFQKIEELAKEEYKPNGQEQQETNVTKRKAGRPRISSSTPHSPVNQTINITSKQSIPPTKETEPKTSTSKQNGTETVNGDEKKDNVSKRPSRTTRKVSNESVETNNTKTVQTRRSKHKLDTSKTDEANSDEEVRYMFPPKSKRLSTKPPPNKKSTQKSQKSPKKTPKIFSSPDNFSLTSMDSTQGYQDSDVSPLKTELRKKKKLNMTTFSIKTRNSLRRNSRRRSYPYLYCDAYNDSSNSSDGPVRVKARENSSQNSEAYRSESYQLLMPKAKNSFDPLEPIDETSPLGNEDDFMKHLESMSKIEISVNNNSNSGPITSDVGSSSVVSLPMSPELSVVENISISKDVLNEIEDYPTLNEIQGNNVKEKKLTSKKYRISDVDISVPLMQQNCGFESCNTITSEASSSDPKSIITESLLSKIGTFKIDEQVTVTSLDQKLHDLLLESAKKMSDNNKESMMDVDVTNINTHKKSKKRCSTPRKRKVSLKSIAPPKVTPVVEEEHVEYSHSGRKSCPPQVQTFVFKENEETNVANQTHVIEKPKARKKKDIIKVKILRPKAKKSQEKRKSKSENESRISITDSGIIDTESGVFLPIDDSIDLIHNHSETCLLANECVGDSVEFVENSKSVITLGDSMQSGDNLWNSQLECNDSISPDLFCNNAQDMKSFFNKSNTDVIESGETVYHSPLGTEVSHNSLMTDDLSDEIPPPRPTKWYLLSEDETTNTNIAGQRSPMLNGFSSNLNQLFPVTCAIPDLSTITEMSKENEDSRKPTLELDGLSGDDFNSQSIFDSNF